MSYVQKNLKSLKEKQKSLGFFETYLDISKLRVLQLLNEEQKALDTLKMVKYSNLKFLEKINTTFFKNERTYIEANDSTRKSREEIFFIVDAKDNDEYSDVIYKKLEETLEAKVKKGDSVVTIGTRVNLIAQKLELNIIQHFPYEVYEKQSEFINKIATLVEVGFKNGIFTDATLIIAQQNQDKKDLIMKKIAPFEYDKSEEEIYSEKTTELSKTSTVDFESIKQNSSLIYATYLANLDIKKLFWIPNITFFKFKLIKAIIKQSIVEITILENIHKLKLELQLLDEKKSKIHDESVIVQRLVNRVRREKETESSIVLYSAFKVRNSGNNILDEVRKKKEEDDILYQYKKVQVKGKGGIK